MQLSPNAYVLLEAIKKSSMWEDQAIEVLFPKPVYMNNVGLTHTQEEIIAAQTAYWQWDANLYGTPNTRPVNGKLVDFHPTQCYANRTAAAVQELKKHGLVKTTNGGYNNYAYHYTGK